ncbi:MAG TPA: hypothetical protein VF017_08375 [Thermoanaerobaculia bacterium]|nr:hypothetical protein [Thermoanaerobaculia bacterium]
MKGTYDPDDLTPPLTTAEDDPDFDIEQDQGNLASGGDPVINPPPPQH